MPRRLVCSLLILAIITLLPPRACAQLNEGSVYGPLPVFEFHSDFWVNLHHTLYQEAKFRPPARTQMAQTNDRDKTAPKSRPAFRTPNAKIPLTPAEQRAWDEALNYYAANYIDKDLLFTTELILIKNQLGDFDGCDELSGRKKKTCDAGLPANLTRVLESAAVVYRAHEWPGHDLANRRWVLRVAPLVREQGLGLSQRLADIYQTKWPKDKIRVDVCAYANRSGAYTTLDPFARHHLQHRPTQSGRRSPRSAFPRSLARHRRNGAASHHPRMPPARKRHPARSLARSDFLHHRRSHPPGHRRHQC